MFKRCFICGNSATDSCSTLRWIYRGMYACIWMVALFSSQILPVKSQNSDTNSAESPLNATIMAKSKTCSSQLFRCPKTGRCIPNSWLCDGDNDCGYGEDEVNCAEKTCHSNEHRCTNSNKCIPERWLCDGEDDCGDMSDEDPEKCKNRTCASDRYECNETKHCIPTTWLCDGQKDCPRGDDEANCTQLVPCSEHEFQCKNGRCIFKRWLCDRDDDCGDRSDEPSECRYTCSSAHFTCQSDKRCIPKRWVCDGERDCPDGSDEADMSCYGVSNLYSNTTCASYDFQCDDGVCIHRNWLCDGDRDCPDGADEAHCDNQSCTPEQFACQTESPFECIPRALRCNGINDCSNGFDERNCSTAATVTPCKPEEEFDCGNGMCIRWNQVCDKKYDCPLNTKTGEYADEAQELCKNKDVDHCKSKPCDKSAQCINTPSGPICACKSGYQKSQTESDQNRLVCEDINECLMQPKQCTQSCVNTDGSFYCGCIRGYIIHTDKLTCRALGNHPQLIFSHRKTIDQIDLHSSRGHHVVVDLKSAVAIDYHYQKKLMIWSDVNEEAIYKVPLPKPDLKGRYRNATKNESTAVVNTGLSVPDGLAVDWIHDLIYWTDTGKNSISVIDIDGKFRRTLIDKDLDEPRAIVLDPIEGLMFWTDWGKEAKIERASMDGTRRNVIVPSKDLVWPNGLTIDYVDKRIFWADAKLHTLMSSDYWGKNVEQILTATAESTLRHPFGLAVFEENVYWTDWDSEGIHAVHKYTGKVKPVPLLKGLIGPMAVRVYHEQNQPDGSNKCLYARNSCNQLCVPSWVDRVQRGKQVFESYPYTCLCADGYQLLNDGFTCVGNGTSSSASSSKSVPVSHEGSTGQHAFLTFAFIACILALCAVVAYIVWRRVYGDPRRPKRLTLENPVYRRTVLEQGTASDHYDHLRLSLDGDQPGMVPSDGVYQPTTTVNQADPDTVAVGVVQNGRYSMKLPLTENEEGPDYA